MKNAMLLRAALTAIVLSLAPTAPALAAGGSAKAEKAGEDAANARALDVNNLVVPVVRDGKLVNYIFLNIRIDLGEGDMWSHRAKSHFVRDAMVRAVHKTSIVHPVRDDQANTTLATQVLMAAAKQVLGAPAVKTLAIVSVSSLRKVAPSRPKA